VAVEPGPALGRRAIVATIMAAPRHARFVRVTHWLTTVAVVALLVMGVEIILSHPRFYWGETGNVNTTPLFTIPVPSSRSTVPTGYRFLLPDQNGWSRYLHFQSAWLALFAGGAYLLLGVRTRHFRDNLMSAAAGDPRAYNPRQRLVYLIVIFGLFPLVIWTGLAMAPGFTAIFPSSVTLLGGRQSARTLHFAGTIALVFFTIVHIVMIIRAGFRARVGAMIRGTYEVRK
jgi:thiosulfate reductase cytochrome b subunit